MYTGEEMKQVSYDFDMRQITKALVCYIPGLEDGCYRWEFHSESVTASVPRVYVEQREGSLPGHIVRITGIKVTRLALEGLPAQKDDTFFIVKNGEVIFYGDDRTPSGFVEAEQDPGQSV